MTIILLIIGMINILVPGIYFRQPMGIVMGILFVIVAFFLWKNKFNNNRKEINNGEKYNR